MGNKIILFGEYLLRLTPPSPQRLLQASQLEMHWAGSEANAAVSLSLLGDTPVYVTSLPSNDLARAGLAELNKHKLPANITWKKNARVGLYFYEAGHGARPGKVLYDREQSAFSLLKTGDINWDEIFDDADWFHWSGITPALNKELAAVIAEALHKAKQKGMIISADFNYRNTLWQYGVHCSDVMPGLLLYCDVILADADSAALYFGIEPGNENLVERTIHFLKNKLPKASYISMTMRKRLNEHTNGYQGFLWHDNKIYSSTAYNINQIADRIGAGDAFMAGLIYALRQKKSPQHIIDFATGCGVIKHSITGDFNIASEDEINIIIKQKGTGKIIR